MIEIRNSAGEVVPNLAVTFATPGIPFGGFFGTSEITFPTTTDANGRASALLIAGTRPATFSVTVTADDLAGVSTSFTATATPGAPQLLHQ